MPTCRRVQGAGCPAGRPPFPRRAGHPLVNAPGGAADGQNRTVLDGARARILAWPRGGADARDPHRRQGGVYYPVGLKLKEILERELKGATVTVRATKGTVENLNLLQR